MKFPNSKFIILSSLFIILAVSLGYGSYQYFLTARGLRQSGQDLSTAQEQLAALKAKNQDLEKELEQTKADNAELAKRLSAEQNKTSLFERQIGEIQSSVNTLTKLSQTDKELLQKYSKVYFLNENYIPSQLTQINTSYVYNPQEDYFFHTKALSFLYKLLDAAKSAGAELEVVSAYRSFGTQESLKSNYKMVYGYGANQFSADQGYSEHQLGTTVDLTTPALGAGFTDFDSVPVYQWMLENAYKYGFVLSYPQDNSYYQFEPWHWRFVGIALATRLHNDNQYFYDLDQRTIDAYLVNIFDEE